MGSKPYFKCPGTDPVSRAMPEMFVCPDCGAEVEIWTDEIKGKCPSCTGVIQKDKIAKVVEKKTPDHSMRIVMEKLTQLACQLGVSDAKAILTTDISIEEDLANLCREPGCENYGLSASCPPHVAGPAGFRKLLNAFKHAIVIKIDVPPAIHLPVNAVTYFGCFMKLPQV